MCPIATTATTGNRFYLPIQRKFLLGTYGPSSSMLKRPLLVFSRVSTTATGETFLNKWEIKRLRSFISETEFIYQKFINKHFIIGDSSAYISEVPL